MTDPKQFERTFEKHSPEIFFGAAISSDKSAAYVGASDGKVYRYDLADANAERKTLDGDGHASYVTGVALAGETLVSVGYDRRIVFWNVSDGKQVRAIDDAHAKWIRGVAAYPDGSRVVTVADDMQVSVWNVATGERLATFSDHAAKTPHHYPSMLYAVAVSRDGKRIATGDRVGHVAIWDGDSYSKLLAVEAPVLYTWDPKARVHSIGGVRSLAFSPDGTKLAVGGVGTIENIDGLEGKSRIEIFDVATGERLRLIEGEKKGLVASLAWANDGSWIVAAGGSGPGFVSFFNAESGERLIDREINGFVHDVEVAADESCFFLAAHERVELWSLKTS